MGCCETANLKSSDPGEKIKNCIETGNIDNLKTIFRLIRHKDPGFDINSLRYTIENQFTVTPMGLAILMGSSEIFKCIYNTMNGDFLLTESLFEEALTTGLSIICLNNYLMLLQEYLPIYLEISKTSSFFKKSDLKRTLNLDDELGIPVEGICPFTPVQLACENGHISIVNYFKTYSSKLDLVPEQIDIHYIDETTGSNCAMLACKANNFTMIKFLFVQCKADFKIINNYNENALNVLAIGSCENRSETFKCLEYLIEKIGVDFEYNYQETILMLDDEKSQEYLEKKLAEKGVQVNLKSIEEQARIRVMRRTQCKEYDTGNRFTFTRLFPDLLRNSRGGNSNSVIAE